MTSKTLQFHAVLEDVPELVELLRKVVTNAHVYLWTKLGGLIDFPADGVSILDIKKATLVIASIKRIDSSVASMNQLLEENDGALFIDIPDVQDGFVREIAAGAKAWNPDGFEQIKVWDKYLRTLRGTLRSGAYISMPMTGKGRYYKNAHVTARAFEESRTGLVLKAVGGDAVYEYNYLKV